MKISMSFFPFFMLARMNKIRVSLRTLRCSRENKSSVNAFICFEQKNKMKSFNYVKEKQQTIFNKCKTEHSKL